MQVRRFVVVIALAFLFAVAAHAQTDVTGVWTGNLTGTCPGGSPTSPFALTLSLQQSGSTITGNGSGTGAQDMCASGSPAENVTISAVSASISGTSISGTLTVVGEGTAPFTATVLSANSMHLTITVGPGETLSGNLTKQAAPSVDVTGTWSGTFNTNDQCDGKTAPWTTPATLAVSQSGSTFAGGVILYAVPFYDDRCAVQSINQIVIPVNGSVSGTTLSGTAAVPGGGATFTGQVSGNSMTINVVTSEFSASSTLTRASSGPMDSHLTGSYSGSYTGRMIPCAGSHAPLAPITYSGSISGSLTQVGNVLFGSFTATNLKQDDEDTSGHCSVITVPSETNVMAGVLTGSAFSGMIIPSDPDDEFQPFSATVSGDTFTGSAPPEFPGESFTFSITRGGGTAAAPQILSFTAAPPTIRAGQAATLSWTTVGATSVFIDKGVSFVGATGSTTVSPATTTTYTLTASVGTTAVTTGSVTVTVLTAPSVNVTEFPSTMLELAGGSGTSTTFAITNSGSTATNVTLARDKDFFTPSPATFALAPGATQLVDVTASNQSAGVYEGTIAISGTGAPAGLSVPVKLVSTAAPTGTVTADPTANRVDTITTSGSVSFKNNGTARLVGVLNSDVPWLQPQGGQVTIDPGQTASFNFTIDRSKRPDIASGVGSAEGSLTLSFFSGGGSSFAAKPLDGTSPIPSVSLVKVIDTIPPAVTTAGIPALGAGEVALFIAGVGHTTGSRGALFVSDVSVLNPQGTRAVDDVKMYYTSTTGSSSAAKTTSLPAVASQTSVAVGDVVKSVFSGSDERGSLQIRSKDAGKLAVAATVLTTNTPAGTYGNTIPVFRSDRAIASGDALVLTGLRKDGTTHTNIYIQEAAGANASVQTDFLAADGSAVGSARTDSIDPFKLLPLDDIVPANAVAAVITNKSTAGGKILAYATPVDQASNDTWAIADWARLYGYAATDQVIVPVAGSVHGANSTFYRTDLSLTNRGSDSATGLLRYVGRDGTSAQQDITIGGKQTKLMNDVVSSFNISGDTVGYLTYTPLSGSVAISSRTFTTVGSKPDSFGSGVPAIAAGSALSNGGTRPIAGLSDATRNTVVSAKPATYRTNFALMETTGRSVTVRVTFRFTFPAGDKAQGVGAASRDYVINANQFLMLNSIAGEILGPARLQYGDLTNVEADFQVVDGTGSVILFTSSVDNATGDTILRTE